MDYLCDSFPPQPFDITIHTHRYTHIIFPYSICFLLFDCLRGSSQHRCLHWHKYSSDNMDWTFFVRWLRGQHKCWWKISIRERCSRSRATCSSFMFNEIKTIQYPTFLERVRSFCLGWKRFTEMFNRFIRTHLSRWHCQCCVTLSLQQGRELINTLDWFLWSYRCVLTCWQDVTPTCCDKVGAPLFPSALLCRILVPSLSLYLICASGHLADCVSRATSSSVPTGPITWERSPPQCCWDLCAAKLIPIATSKKASKGEDSVMCYPVLHFIVPTNPVSTCILASRNLYTRKALLAVADIHNICVTWQLYYRQTTR